MQRLTPEELLMPRRKVIAPYPYSVLSVGYIITEPVPLLQAQALINAVASMDYIDQFPNIFEPMHWWMDREESQMPEYVKIENRIIKVKKWVINERSVWLNLPHPEPSFTMGNKFYPTALPAKQAEYDLFQQSQTKH